MQPHQIFESTGPHSWKLEQEKFKTGKLEQDNYQEDTAFETNSFIAEVSGSYLKDLYTSCQSKSQSANTSMIASEDGKEYLRELYFQGNSLVPSHKTSEAKTECNEFLQEIYQETGKLESRKSSLWTDKDCKEYLDELYREGLMQKSETSSVMTKELCRDYLQDIYREGKDSISDLKSSGTSVLCKDYLKGIYSAQPSQSKSAKPSEITAGQCKEYLQDLYEMPSFENIGNSEMKHCVTRSEKNIPIYEKSKSRSSKDNLNVSEDFQSPKVFAISEIFDPNEPVLKHLDDSDSEKPANKIEFLRQLFQHKKPEVNPSPKHESIKTPEKKLPMTTDLPSSMKKKEKPEIEEATSQTRSIPDKPSQLNNLKKSTIGQVEPEKKSNNQKHSHVSYTYSEETPSPPVPKAKMTGPQETSNLMSTIMVVDEEEPKQTTKKRVAKGKPIDCWLVTESRIWPSVIINEEGFIWDDKTKKIEVKEGDKVSLVSKVINLQTSGVCSKLDPKIVNQNLVYLTDFFITSPRKEKFLISTQRLPHFINKNCKVFLDSGKPVGEAFLKFESSRVNAVLVKSNDATLNVVASIDIKASQVTVWERPETPRCYRIKESKQKSFHEIDTVVYTLDSKTDKSSNMLVVPNEFRYPIPDNLLNGTKCKLFLNERPVMSGELKCIEGPSKRDNHLQFWLDWKPEGEEPWFTDSIPADLKKTGCKRITSWTQERPRYLTIEMKAIDFNFLNNLHYKVKEWIYSLIKTSKGSTFASSTFFKNSSFLEAADIIAVSPKESKNKTFKGQK